MAQPAPPTVCAGDPREIGASLGAALGEQIRGCAAALDEIEAFQARRSWYLPKPLFRWLAQRRATAAWRDHLAAAVPDMAARLAGMAEAARIDLRELQLLNVLEPLLADLRGSAVPVAACSALAIRGARSAQGPVLHHNFDYIDRTAGYQVLREVQPKGGLRSLEFTIAPLCGAIDGINEAGLAITYDYAFVIDGGDPRATISMAISRALARCRSTAEAVDLFAGEKVWGGGLLLLGDAAGDLVSLALSNTRQLARRPEGSRDALFHTNRFAPGPMRQVELHEDACFGPRAVAAMRGVRIHESSALRDVRLAEIAGEDARLSADELWARMADHRGAEPSRNTVCMHGPYWSTTACVQLLPQARRMRAFFGRACEARFVEFGL